MFTSEEDFLRHFQAEAAQLRLVDPEPAAAETSALIPPVIEPLPLRTEEDFLRLFQAEMQVEVPHPESEMSPFSLVVKPEPMATAAPVLSEPEPEVEQPLSFAIEQVLAAEMPLPPEEVMNRNAAWLLGLEPLPVIEFDEPRPAASAMLATIPDRIEIPSTRRADTFGAEGHGVLRPSSQGAMVQLLECEPEPELNPESMPKPDAAPTPNLMPMPKQETVAEPEIVVPAWLQAQMQRDMLNSFPTEVIPKQEPSGPVITPRRMVPKAPVTVEIEQESRNWLNWWK